MLKVVDENETPMEPLTRSERFVRWLRGYGIDKYLIGSTTIACTVAVLVGALLHLLAAR